MIEETFISHLVELRDRLIRALIAIGVVFAVLCFVPGPSTIYDWLALPLTRELPMGTKMIATGVITPFMVPIKLTMMVSFVLSLPVVLHQVWAFVAPGLYAHEKKLILPLVVSSTLLFILGLAFCYFFVFGQVFRFISHFAPASITPAPDIEQYLSFVMTMFLAFGLAFEVPVALIVLVRLGVVTVMQLRTFRAYFVVCASIISAVVTPPDVVSMLCLLIPLCILYEVGIWAAHCMSTIKAPESHQEVAEDANQKAAEEFAAIEKDQNSGKP